MLYTYILWITIAMLFTALLPLLAPLLKLHPRFLYLYILLSKVWRLEFKILQERYISLKFSDMSVNISLLTFTNRKYRAELNACFFVHLQSLRLAIQN